MRIKSDIVEVWGNVKNSDGKGGFVYSEQKLFEIKGVISFLSAKNRIIGNKDSYLYTHLLYCEYNSNITEENFIKYNGEKFLIKGIYNPNYSNYHLEIDLLKVK